MVPNEVIEIKVIELRDVRGFPGNQFEWCTTMQFVSMKDLPDVGLARETEAPGALRH